MRRVVTTAFCDWHNDGETEAVEPPIRWKEGDSTYELDLCRDCKVEHRAGARRITKRKVTKKRVVKPRVKANNGNGRRHSVPESREVREWARANKIHVAPSGKVPDDVMRQFEAAMS